MKNGKVLVLGNDTRSFLTVIRSLGRRNIAVHIAWCDRNCPSRYSRYVDAYHDVPRFDPQNENWKKPLQDVLRREKLDLVIPCNDPSLIPLQAHRKDFEPLARLYLPDDEVSRITSNKQETSALARKYDVPVPAEVQLQSVNEIDAAVDRLRLPVVLKPLLSFTPDDLRQHHDVRKAFDLEEARRIATAMLARGPVLLQENCVGHGTGIEIIANSGHILSAFQHLRLHEPVHGGAASYRKSIRLDPDMYGAVATLVAALNYTGVAMFEFKGDPDTGKWVFLEVNARFWGSLPLAVEAGIDFPWYLYDMLVNGQTEFNKAYKLDVYCRDLLRDIDWFRDNLHADRSDPLLHTVSVRKFITEFRYLATLRERSDTIVADDLRPALVDIKLWLQGKQRSLQRKVGVYVRSLELVRGILCRRVVQALADRRHILYVCTGNICRSPFARYFTASLVTPEWTIDSAGLLPPEGRACPENAVTSALAFDIDLARHVSAKMRETTIREAGIIFVFDEAAFAQLRDTYPFARSKIYYLGIFLERDSIIITDPYGKDGGVFDVTYNKIVRAVTRLKFLLDQLQPQLGALA